MANLLALCIHSSFFEPHNHSLNSFDSDSQEQVPFARLFLASLSTKV